MTQEEKQAAREAARIHLLEFLRILRSFPDPHQVSKPVYESEQLEKALQAFHMEAIRFRIYSLDRFVNDRNSVATAEARQTFGELKKALEAAGFQTR